MLKKLFGLFMVMSMDAGLGLLIAHDVGKLMGRPVQWWEYLIGVGLALAPDLDIPIKLLTNGRPVDSAHRHGVSLHCPLLVLPIASTLAATIEPFWGWVTGLCLFVHYLHDSVGECNEWGVEWLWPLGTRSYLLFPRGLWGPVLHIYNREEVGAHCVWAWVERWYLRPTWESVTGVAVLAAALVIVLTT